MVLDKRRSVGIWGGAVEDRHNNRRKGGRYHRTEGERACNCAGARVVRTAAIAAVPIWQRISHALSRA